MDKNQNKNNLENFSDLNDEIIIREEDGNFKVFSLNDIIDSDTKRAVQKVTTDLMDTGMEEKAIAPLTPMIRDNKSNFYFDIDDEEDVKKYKNNIVKANTDSKKYSLDRIVEKIIQNYNLNLLRDLENKLKNVILSFLKHTRDRVSVINTLRDPISKGGLNLSIDISSKIVDLLSDIRDKIDEVHGVIIYEKLNENINYSNKIEDNNIGPFSNLDPRQSIKIESKNTDIPLIRRNVFDVNKQVLESKKPKITGVRPMQKVVSPVEELKEVTIGVFRRLSSNPIEASQKIVEKIKTFEKESYIKKSMAIKYWRDSEVYKTYLALGRESMEKNVSIDKIIEQKILSHENTLSREEFSAISDLNKKIKF
ncbi:MAG: hypothetical protein PHZ07_04215 [Patescibacteria group bacterium]|nr:hypothetical protein [Patescibacteria group bacterium]MDD4304767.1 hypothetical protein [Patescibacteria group bacterium]MDD4695494.1 hypothetical protein [Patescibacteria group bacterium]